jgi:serine/threonine-protein kinase haspin
MFLHSNPLSKSPPEESMRSWREYCPATNVVWLHFVLYNLLSALDSCGSLSMDVRSLSPGQTAKVAAKKAAQLRRRLKRLNETLDFRIEREEDNELFASAGEIVEWAVEVGWLDEADVLEASWRSSDGL